MKETDRPYVLIDKSFVQPGGYNVVEQEGQILVMSKKLEYFNARYCCMSKLDAVSARLVKREIDNMINSNMYDQYFEDSLVQMIMFHGFQLFGVDVNGHEWNEVDVVDDMLNAQKIHGHSKLTVDGGLED